MNKSTVDVRTETPVRITNKENDVWYTYDGELLFELDNIERISDRFDQMDDHDWERIAYVRNDDYDRTTKIRTKDIESFKEDLKDAYDEFIEEWGHPLTRFGNVGYCDEAGPFKAVGIRQEGPRKSIVRVAYKGGGHAGLGGATYKKDKVLKEVRHFEQWLVHTEVVQPLLDEYNEKYPY